MRTACLGLLLFVAGACASSESGPAPIDSVDPRIGTGGRYFGHGAAFAGASLPFGMAKPGPDTSEENGVSAFHHFSGYHAEDTLIHGFSQVHISGTGAVDYGALLLQPAATFDLSRTYESGYRLRFSKENEHLSPGLYRVTFDDPAISVEASASQHCSAYRIAYPPSLSERWLILDLGHALPDCRVEDARFDVADGAVTGWVHYRGALTGRSGGFRLYFKMILDTPIQEHVGWSGRELFPAADSLSGPDIGLALRLGAGDPVQVRFGLSYVDEKGAADNLAREMPDWDFDALVRSAREAWANLLDRVEVEGGGPEARTLLYTALYHAFLHPTMVTDGDGRYRGFDKEIHVADGFLYYTDFSLWDTYRTEHPLLTLLLPSRARDMARSLVLMAEQGGALPRWPAGLGDSGSMIGTPADIVLADSYLKGVTDFDIERALHFILDHAENDRPGGRTGIDDYLSLGYVACDRHGGGAALTLEFAIADGAIANLLEALGRPDVEKFRARSRNYARLFDADTGFMRGRKADGSWMESEAEFDPLDTFAQCYVEGDAWQYTFLAPHDPEGLRDLFGSAEAFAEKLEAFFATPEPDNPLAEFLPRSYYWPGNEPNIHSAYLFDVAGRPDRAQYWSREAAKRFYGLGPDGIPGNDDLGTMSAWLFFTAAGFYPLAGTERYLLGSPWFDRMTLRLENGRVFEIRADGAAERIYVRQARLDGAALQDPWLVHADIAAGGTLEFDMSENPGPFLR